MQLIPKVFNWLCVWGAQGTSAVDWPVEKNDCKIEVWMGPDKETIPIYLKYKFLSSMAARQIDYHYMNVLKTFS